MKMSVALGAKPSLVAGQFEIVHAGSLTPLVTARGIGMTSSERESDCLGNF
jgi:hypothetical protein